MENESMDWWGEGVGFKAWNMRHYVIMNLQKWDITWGRAHPGYPVYSRENSLRGRRRSELERPGALFWRKKSSSPWSSDLGRLRGKSSPVLLELLRKPWSSSRLGRREKLEDRSLSPSKRGRLGRSSSLSLRGRLGRSSSLSKRGRLGRSSSLSEKERRGLSYESERGLLRLPRFLSLSRPLEESPILANKLGLNEGTSVTPKPRIKWSPWTRVSDLGWLRRGMRDESMMGERKMNDMSTVFSQIDIATSITATPTPLSLLDRKWTYSIPRMTCRHHW